MLQVLHALAQALEAFHHLDPAGWFAWHRMLGPSGGIAAMLAGLFCLGAGGREGIFRFVAVPLGLLMGVALTPPVLELARGTSIPPHVIELALPGALALLSGFLPQTIAFASLGAVGARVGTEVVAEHELLVGALPGFFLAGMVGIVFSRVFETLAAAALGGLLLVGGVLAAFPHGMAARLLGGSPWVPAICWALLTAGGAALQMVLYDDADTRAEKKAQARAAKERAKEEKAREKRFASYGKH